MLKISLYQNICVGKCVICISTYDYGKNKSYTTDRPTAYATGRRLSPRQEPCIPYALSRSTFEIHRLDLGAGWSPDGNEPHLRKLLGEAFRGRGHQRVENAAGTRTEANNGQLGRRGCTHRNRKRQAKCKEGERSLAASLWQRGQREYLQIFFIHIGARYRRIRKCPKGKPSPQLYAYKTEKLQELERQANAGLIDLYYGDESHICTEGYVPYGWQFRGEDVYIPSERGCRLNIFGMIDRNNRYEGFSTMENMTADTIADFLDRLSMRIRKNTFVVLDNASVHRCKLMKELRPIWERRGLFIFFLPPYSPHLNIAETLWRILKGKWLRPADYFSTDSLLYATNRALAAIGTELNINFAHVA